MASWRENVLPILGLTLFISCVVWAARYTQAAQRRSRYTIGSVTGWSQTLKSGRAIKYRCAIRAKDYRSSALEEPGVNSTPGTRYVVAFDSLDPSNNWMYFSMPVPDSVRTAPLNGWSPHAFKHLHASWQYADSVAQTRQVAQQDSLQLVRWQQAQQR